MNDSVGIVGEMRRTVTNRNGNKEKGRRVTVKNRETLHNGMKRNGVGEVGRMQKYRNRKKKKGSRSCVENGEVSEW